MPRRNRPHLDDITATTSVAADVLPWQRPDANACPDRAFCHIFGHGEAKHQVVPGSPYSVVAALKSGRTSWTAVLDAVRLEPGADVAAVTAVQIREVVEQPIAAGQWKSGDPKVLVVLDAGPEPLSSDCGQRKSISMASAQGAVAQDADQLLFFILEPVSPGSFGAQLGA